MDEVNVKEIVCKKGDGELSVELDTALTPELIQEGIARELVRTINGMRKKAGLTIEDRISIVYSTGDVDISTAIEKFGVEITRDTLADSIQSGDTGDMEEIKVNNGNIKLKISH